MHCAGYLRGFYVYISLFGCFLNCVGSSVLIVGHCQNILCFEVEIGCFEIGLFCFGLFCLRLFCLRLFCLFEIVLFLRLFLFWDCVVLRFCFVWDKFWDKLFWGKLFWTCILFGIVYCLGLYVVLGLHCFV
jgi:hypothetical protein